MHRFIRGTWSLTSLACASSLLLGAEPNGGLYPSARNPGMFVKAAESLVINSVVRYYTVYGVYPETWSDVRQSGICQVELTRDGDNIFSLDNELNGSWDAQYVYAGAQSPPTLVSNSSDGPISLSLAGTSASTWDEVATKQLALATSEESSARSRRILADKRVQRLLALKGMVGESIHLYIEVHGQPPQSWQNLLDSGLCAIDADSVNPVTGGMFEGNGGRNDFLYEYTDEFGYRLQIFDEFGEPYWLGSDL
jgi:hypothetical protein